MEWEIDPRNPGEVFACAGLAHLAWQSNPRAETGFEMDYRCQFKAPDLSAAFDRLALADGKLEGTKYGLRFADVTLDWWREWGLNTGLKFWAGQQSASTVHTSLLGAAKGSHSSCWLTHSAPATARLNLDTISNWNALSLGWSLNEHRDAKMLCRPWLEILASIGLQAFPVEGDRKVGFRYSLWRRAPLAGAVAAFGGHGPSIYAFTRYLSPTAKAGSNTILRVADPMRSDTGAKVFTAEDEAI